MFFSQGSYVIHSSCHIHVNFEYETLLIKTKKINNEIVVFVVVFFSQGIDDSYNNKKKSVIEFSNTMATKFTLRLVGYSTKHLFLL